MENCADGVRLTGNPNTVLLEQLMKKAAATHIPRGASRSYRPFWSPRIDKLRQKRNECRKEADRTNSPINKGNLMQAQSALSLAIQEGKDDKFKKFLLKMDYRKDALKSHSFFSNLCGKKANKTDENAPLHYKGKTAATNNEVLCRHFKQISTPRRLKAKKLPAFKYKHEPNDFNNQPFDMQKLKYAISQLENRKAPGPDHIHVEFLKHLGPKALALVLNIVDSSWTCFPPDRTQSPKQF